MVEEAFKYSNARTKKDLIQEALMAFVENRRRLNLLDLKGKIEFIGGYDYKARALNFVISRSVSDEKS